MNCLIFNALASCSDRAAVFATITDYFDEAGFRAACYIVPSVKDDGAFDLTEFGFPQEWVRRYLVKGVGEFDPNPGFAMQHGRVFWWSEIKNLKRLSRNEERYFTELAQFRMTDGLALPTYGLKQRAAFFGIGMMKDKSVKSNADAALLQAVAQAAHLRLDQLVDQNEEAKSLSFRERQILHWMSAGKSNNEIATILGISSATVATYNKRIFDKLGVNDRVMASTKAMRLGFV